MVYGIDLFLRKEEKVALFSVGSFGDKGSNPAGKINFSAFKQSFSTNVNYLKRRFSSGDLSSEYEDGPQIGPDGQPIPGPPPGKDLPPARPASTTPGQAPPPQDLNIRGQGAGAAPPAAAPPQGINPKTTSAPTSPVKGGSSLLQRVQSLTGVAREVTSNITSQVMASAGSLGQQQPMNRLPLRQENCLVLLVIDDANTDWSKYFKSRKINDLDLRVEQAEFCELSIVAGADFGCVVSYPTWKDGNRMVKSFQPDFVLIRQNLRDAGRDYKNLLLALMYGGVPSVNSLPAVYNFQDKPWVFAHMMNIQRKYGRDAFPLIDQYFYPDFKEMGTMVPRLPAVLKIGHAHGGLGKIRAGTLNDYQDASSVVAVTATYCTSEPYVEARCDVHIQKIGNQYKAFMRKGIVGHWKSGSGSAMLEQVAMNDRYRNWVDSVATLFGGLDICALEVIVGKDGKEYIIEVNDSALSLMGESQEEDRRNIAELVISRMSLLCKPPGQLQQSTPQRYRRQSGSSIGSSSGFASGDAAAGSVSSASAAAQPSTASDSVFGSSSTVNEASSTASAPVRRDSQSSTSSKTSFFTRQNSQQAGGVAGAGAPTKDGGDDTEDTMKNLRKTFAGIFGDM